MKGRSGDSERVLFLSPEAPYPLAGGGAMRTAGLLQYLSRRYPIHLVVFAEEGTPDPQLFLPPGLVRKVDTIRLPYHRRGGVTRVCRNTSRLLRGRLPLMDRFTQRDSLLRVEAATRGRRYRLAVIEHFWCAEYLRLLRERADCVVLDLHNIESVLHSGCAETEPWPQNLGHRFFHHRASQLERRLLAQFDLVLTTSEADAGRVRAICPGVHAAVYPNSLPLRDAPTVPEELVLGFSGNLEYHPNITAVRFFATQVWQVLKMKHASLVWRLIGKNPHAVQDLVGADPRIELTGEVADALPEIARACIAIAPLLAGSGTRVKIMEAWAAARPVISSPVGAEGLPIVNGENIVLAESPGEWVDQVLKLLGCPEQRRKLGAAGRAVFERELCWPAAWKRLDEVIPPLLAAHRVVAAS
jgi:glycosyltransferase involved in cell wall biosynthesis